MEKQRNKSEILIGKNTGVRAFPSVQIIISRSTDLPEFPGQLRKTLSWLIREQGKYNRTLIENFEFFYELPGSLFFTSRKFFRKNPWLSEISENGKYKCSQISAGPKIQELFKSF